jgi:hypothetical protein
LRSRREFRPDSFHGVIAALQLMAISRAHSECWRNNVSMYADFASSRMRASMESRAAASGRAGASLSNSGTVPRLRQQPR